MHRYNELSTCRAQVQRVVYLPCMGTTSCLPAVHRYKELSTCRAQVHRVVCVPCTGTTSCLPAAHRYNELYTCRVQVQREILPSSTTLPSPSSLLSLRSALKVLRAPGGGLGSIREAEVASSVDFSVAADGDPPYRHHFSSPSLSSLS